jgi:hypothetical protein
MTPQIFVRPKPGLIVRRPDTMEPLPEGGACVPRDRHWLRILRDGDITECEPPPEPGADSPQFEKSGTAAPAPTPAHPKPKRTAP